MDSAIDRINLRTMRSSEVVAHYARPGRLLPHEQAALDLVANEFRGQPVLDIGVGGGRTVTALLEVSPDYLGVDYSAEMVAACQRQYPLVRFEHADARHLSGLPDGSISLAVFSCNGISMVGHADRLQIIREVHRVLRPGGVFLFTTYNRNSPEARAGFRFPEFHASLNPARMAVRLARLTRDTAVSLHQRRKNLRHEVHTPHYAVLNDKCHNYGVMLYYITLDQQRRQLEAAGFDANGPAFDCNGRQIVGECNLDSMALIARKP
jgi:SAM-dependent methyltransferase